MNQDIKIQVKNDIQKLDVRNLFIRGGVMLSCGHNEIAIEYFNESIRRDPNRTLDYYYRGNANAKLGCYEKAIEDYNQAIRLNPEYVDAFIDRGNVKANLGLYEEALEDYNEAIRLDPKHAKAFYNRGITNIDLGRHQEALKDYNEAIRLDPKYADAFYNRGLAKVQLGHYEAAIEDYNETIRLDPKEDASVFCSRGNAKNNLGRYSAAIEDYSKALQLNPKYTEAFKYRGLAQVQLSHYEAAIKDFNEFIKLKPSSADVFHRRGYAKARLNHYKAALEDYNEAIRLDPNNADFFESRSIIQFRLGHYEAAIKDTNEAIRLDPKSASAFCSRSIVQFHLGDYEAAIKDTNEAIRLDPKSASAFCSRGRIEYRLGRYENAFKDFNQAIKFDPTDSTVFCNRGFAYTELGRHEAALEDFNEAVRLDSKDAAVFYFRGISKHNLNCYETAIEDYNEAIRLDPKLAEAFNNRGLTKYVLGLYENAIEDFRQAIGCCVGYVDPWTNIAYSSMCLQNINEAEEYLKWALVIKGDFPFALQCKGLIALYQHNQPKAEQHFVEVTQYYQQNKNLFKKFEQCELYFIKAETCLALNFIEEAKDAIKKVLELNNNFMPALKLQEKIKIGFREFKYSELEIDENQPLGVGGFATVYKGKGKWNNKVYAIKKLHNHLQFKDKESINFINEVILMSQLNNHYIIQVFGACTEVGKYCIVMECCDKGSLSEWLKTSEANNWPLRLRIAADIGKGLMYLHDASNKKEILHRDLKSQNVVLDKNLVAKITDFGLSKILETTNRNNSSKSIKGTLEWIDPEIFQGKPYSKEHDIYSYGMVLWHIHARENPYKNKNDFALIQSKMKGENEIFHENTPLWYKELVNKCWTKEIILRLDAKGVVETLMRSNDYPKAAISTLLPDKSNKDVKKQLKEALEQKRESQLSARFSAISIQPHLLPSSVKPAAAVTNSMVLNELPLQSALPTSIQKPADSSTSLGGSRNNLYGGYIERFSATSLEARNKSRTTIGAMPEDVERKNVPRP